jgi:hypothetical protein
MYKWHGSGRVYSAQYSDPTFTITLDESIKSVNKDNLYILILRSLDDKIEPSSDTSKDNTDVGKLFKKMKAIPVKENTLEYTFTDTDNPYKPPAPKPDKFQMEKMDIVPMVDIPPEINNDKWPPYGKGYKYGDFPWNYNPDDGTSLPVYYKTYLLSGETVVSQGKEIIEVKVGSDTTTKLSQPLTRPVISFTNKIPSNTTLQIRRIAKPINAETNWKAPDASDTRWDSQAKKIKVDKLGTVDVITSWKDDNGKRVPVTTKVENAWQDTENPFQDIEAPVFQGEYSCPITDNSEVCTTLQPVWRMGLDSNYNENRKEYKGAFGGFIHKGGYTTLLAPLKAEPDTKNRILTFKSDKDGPNGKMKILVCFYDFTPPDDGVYYRPTKAEESITLGYDMLILFVNQWSQYDDPIKVDCKFGGGYKCYDDPLSSDNSK